MTRRAKFKKQFDAKIKKAVARLKKHYDPEKIILYGSVARGDFDEDSDIDLLIVKKGVEKCKPFDRIYQVLTLFGDDIDMVEPKIYSPRELRQRIENNDWYLSEAEREGKLLYEKQR